LIINFAEEPNNFEIYINLLGHYNFQLQEPRSLDDLRPLRNEADIEATDDDLHQQLVSVAGVWTRRGQK